MMRGSIVSIVLVALSTWTTSLAQTAPAVPVSAEQQKSAAKADLPPPPVVRIEMEASRAQATAGEGIGVAATITNESAETPVTIRETGVTLTVPPEMTGAFDPTGTWNAYFPTEHEPNPNQPHQFGTVTLQPKSSYQVFWRPTGSQGREVPANATVFRSICIRMQNLTHQVVNSLEYVFFTPGRYKLTAQVKYWSGLKANEGTYYTVAKTTELQIAAPQSVIMLGAVVGGIIAFAVLPRSRRYRTTVTATDSTITSKDLVGRMFPATYGIVGAAMLSVIVTILLARMSETQFLVKVTINDFWGAIAIGFIANYLGSRALDRLLPASQTTATVNQTVPAAQGSGKDVAVVVSTPDARGATDASEINRSRE